MKVTRTVDEGGTIRYRNEKGLLHREDGPAYEGLNYQVWYINGKCHREDGPAVIWYDGDEWYYLDSIEYPKEDWERERLKWLDHRGFPHEC